jgi:hypothetical protein
MRTCHEQGATHKRDDTHDDLARETASVTEILFLHACFLTKSSVHIHNNAKAIARLYPTCVSGCYDPCDYCTWRSGNGLNGSSSDQVERCLVQHLPLAMQTRCSTVGESLPLHRNGEGTSNLVLMGSGHASLQFQLSAQDDCFFDACRPDTLRRSCVEDVASVAVDFSGR